MPATFPSIEAPTHRPEVSEVYPPWPFFGDEEVEAAAKVLRSGKVNYWTGSEGRRFEEEFAEFSGCKHAIAVANGTVALELSLRALGIGPGDEVITTSRTFIASASSIVAVGARPVFADVDLDSQNLTAASVEAVLTPATRAIIPVHLAGWPCEMDELMELAREHGLYVVEDCAQAQGATYKGRPVGSIGDIGAFSFCQDKNMTTAGEGGMVTTNREDLWRSMWAYKDHGKSFQTVYETIHAPGYRWLHESFGTNWRLSEVQSAVGRVALRRLPGWVDIREQHAARLLDSFSEHSALHIPERPAHIRHANYKFYAFVRQERLAEGWSRDRIAMEISSLGVPCTTGSCSEVYLEKAFPEDMRPKERLHNAMILGETSLMFQVHPTLHSNHIEHACEAVAQVMQRAVRT